MEVINNDGMVLNEPDVPVEHATFGQQCFWAPDGLYGVVNGVIRTKVGYTGGNTKDPSYRNLGDHTEAVDIEFVPSKISYHQLLDIFWESHDSTINHKQQYKSAIFYNNEEQKFLAEESLREHEKSLSKPIVTQILPLKTFYDAEDYHQKYRLRGYNSLLESLKLSDGKLKRSHIAARLNGYLGGFGTLQQFDDECNNYGITEDQINFVRQQILKGNFGGCSKNECSKHCCQ